MMEKNGDNEFVERVRAALDDDAEHMDAATRSRLNRIRQATLDQAAAPRAVWPTSLFKWSAPALAMAALVAVVYTTTYRPMPLDQEFATIEDLEIIAADDQLDLFEELDFYTWLAEVEPDAV